MAQQEWKWMIGGGGENNDLVYAVTVGQNNIIYVAGGFRDQATIAGVELTSNGDNDIFLAAFDTLGNNLWLVQEGGTNHEWASCIVTDESYLYIAGSFKTETTIGGNTIASYNANTDDIFIAKYDLNGNFQWVKAAGGIQDDMAQGIALDGSSNIYITGPINHTAYFDDITVSWAGLSDLFLAKYSSQGDCIWAKGFGGASYDYAFDIAVDHNNNPVVGGRFYETVQFGTYSLTSVHYADAFLLKCTPDGEVTWVKQAGGEFHDHVTSVTIDSDNNCYVAGWYMGDINFDDDQHFSAGSMDIFFARYNESGDYQWSKSFGNIDIDEATALSCSQDDKILLAGEFQISIDFGIITLTAQAYYDGFIACFEPDGSTIWADQVKSAGNIDLRDGAVGQAGDYYAAGGFLEDISAGIHHMSSNGSLDYFLCRLGKGSSRIDDSEYPSEVIIIYPIPADEILNISWPNTIRARSLSIYNLVGQELHHQDISIEHSHLMLPIDELYPGMYIIEIGIEGPENKVLRKVIVH